MSEVTTIEWTDATWNPITGCSVLSPGCTHCYAMMLAGGRLRNHPSRAGLTLEAAAGPVWTGEVRFNDQWLDQPQRWRRPRDVFVCAHSDLFQEAVPDAWIDRVFAVMQEAPWHRYQVLTKRAARMRRYLSASDRQARISEAAQQLHDVGKLRLLDDPSGVWPLPQVHLGVSAEDQRRADERILDLLATPSKLRWVSLEPLLGPIDLTRIKVPAPTLPKGIVAVNDAVERDAVGGTMITQLGMEYGGCIRLDWVVAGGESGRRARPCDVAWLRAIVRQCHKAGVPVHVKQLGAQPRGWCAALAHASPEDRADCEPGHCPGRCGALVDAKGGDMNEWPEDLRVREMPRVA